MKLNITAFMVLAGLLCVSLASAQDADDVNGALWLTGKTTLDRSVESIGDQAQITASTDGGNATVKISRTLSEPNNGNFSSYTITASAPLGKGSDKTDLLSLEGARNNFNLGFKYTWFNIGFRSNPLLNEETSRQLDKICDALTTAYKTQTGKEDEPDCDSNNIKTFLPGRYLEYTSLFFSKEGWMISAGVEPTIGYKTFSFLDSSTVKKNSTSKVPLGINGFFGGMPPGWDLLMVGGFNYQRGFKDADSQTLCPPASAGSTVACQTGSVGKPKSDDIEILYIELRKKIGSVGASLKVSYDFKQDLTGVDLPISFVKDKDGNLTGGVRVGWTKTSHWQAGIFAGTAFKLFDR